MKQIVIDDCLDKVENRFELVRIVSHRVKQLNNGLKPLIDPKGEKNILLSMREIANGKVFLSDENITQDEE